MKKITLFIISKDNSWITEVKNYFNKNEYNLMIESQENQVLEKFYEYNTEIDYIIMASRTLNHNLLQMIQTVRGYSEIPIFLLCDNLEEETQMMFYKAGIEDYLPYNYSLRLLSMKLQIMNKRLFGKNEVIKEGILEINPFRKKIKVNEEDVAITVKEFELLYYLLIHKKVIQTRDQILTAVWGINYMGNDRVVDSLVKKLRNKLGEAANYIKTVYAMGYYFEAPESTEDN